MQLRLLHDQLARMTRIPHPRQGSETWDILWREGYGGWGGEVGTTDVRGIGVRSLRGVGAVCGVVVRRWPGEGGRWIGAGARGGGVGAGIPSCARDRAFAAEFGEVVSPAALARATTCAGRDLRAEEGRVWRRRWWWLWWRVVVVGHHHAGGDHVGEHVGREVLHGRGPALRWWLGWSAAL